MRSNWIALSRLGASASLLVALLLAFVVFSGGSPASAQQPATSIDPGPGTEYLAPSLWALLQRHADGDAEVPVALEVHLTYSSDHSAAVQQAITDAGGTDGDAGIRVPTDKLLGLVQHPHVTSATLATEAMSGATGAANRASMNDTLARIV